MDYTLYYWDLPFRGIFPETVLAEARQSYERASPTAIYPDARLDQHVPGMAPPYLRDHAADRTLSQMPAITLYLAGRHGLLPDEPFSRAVATKLVLDANDVLEEISLNGGRDMWGQASWEAFRADRLAEWMRIFEVTYRQHEGDWMLGDGPTVADLATQALWGTMTHALPPLRDDLDRNAPSIAAITDRVAHREGVAAMLRDRRPGDRQSYCGGQIEASLRAVLGL